MDGTLLTSEHVLSPRTRAALTALIAQGYHIVVATGRPFGIARRLCAGVPFVAPQISYNGAVVFDPVADRPLSQSTVPPGHVPNVVDFLLDAGFPVVACAADGVYLDERIPNPEDWVPPDLAPGIFLEDMRQVPAEHLIKIVGQSDPDAISCIRPRAIDNFGQDLYVTQTSQNLIEFLNPAVSKGAALHRIAGSLGVSQDQILVFGDSHNDLTMFDVAGLSVAMGNASAEVKEAADRVTLTNDEDGVVAVLEDLVLVAPDDNHIRPSMEVGPRSGTH